MPRAQLSLLRGTLCALRVHQHTLLASQLHTHTFHTTSILIDLIMFACRQPVHPHFLSSLPVFICVCDCVGPYVCASVIDVGMLDIFCSRIRSGQFTSHLPRHYRL